MNLNHPLEQAVKEHRGKLAIKHPSGEISYGVFHEAVKRLARGLQKLGVNRGDRVAIKLPNLPHFPIAYYAALRLGAVVVPMNTMHKGHETARLLEDSEAKVLITWQGLWGELSRHLAVMSSLKHILIIGDDIPTGTISLTPLIARSSPLAHITEVDEEDPAIIQYTAGVTGTPKGVELTHGNILSNVNASREIMRVTADDEFLAVLPFFLPMGQTLLLHLALNSGAALNLYPKFDPEEIVSSILNGTSSLFVGVPSMFRLLLDSIIEKITEENLPVPEQVEEEPTGVDTTVRLCICGGGGIPEDVLKEFEKKFDTYILECYTTAETSPVISFNQWRQGRRVGSLGHPIPGVEMKVVSENDEEVSIGEVGEIVVKGPNIMQGYINRPRASAEILKDGWFHTGDLGKMDINGFFYLVDRLNDRIIKGGFSIYPSEVEAVLYGHPDIEEVAVVPIPDEVMGQEVKACIVLKEDATVTTEQLGEYCQNRMAMYKVPAVIRFYKDLPRTPTGRIDKKELRN